MKNPRNFTKIHVKFVEAIFSKFKKNKMKKIYGKSILIKKMMMKYSLNSADNVRKRFKITTKLICKKRKKIKRRFLDGFRIE